MAQLDQLPQDENPQKEEFLRELDTLPEGEGFSEDLFQMYLDTKKAGTKTDELKEQIGDESKLDILEKMEREHTLLIISAASIPPAARSTIVQNIRKTKAGTNLPDSMELSLQGEPLALTVMVKLDPIKEICSSDIALGEELTQRAKNYLQEHKIDTDDMQDQVEILEAVQLQLRNKAMELVGDNAHLSLRGPERATGVIGSNGVDQTVDKLSGVLNELNSEITEIFGMEFTEAEKKRNTLIVLSEDVQKAAVEKISKNNGVVRSTIDFFEGDSLVLANNVAMMETETLPGQLVVISKRTPNEGEITIDIKKKGTSITAAGYRARKISDNDLASETPEFGIDIYDLSILRRIEDISIDQFISSKAVHAFLDKNPEFEKQIRENGGFSLRMAEAAYTKILMDISESSVVAKPDISGFSKLTVFMEEEMGIPPKIVTYPYFSKLTSLAEDTGALIDRFAGDSGDAAFPPENVLEQLGMSNNISEHFKNMTPQDRAYAFALGAKAIFEGMLYDIENMDPMYKISEDPEEYTSFGKDLFGTALSEINVQNYEEVKSAVQGLSKALQEEYMEMPAGKKVTIHESDKAVMTQLITAYSLALFKVKGSSLGIKAISQDGDTSLNFTVIGSTIVQEISATRFSRAEHELETRAKQTQSGIVYGNSNGIEEVTREKEKQVRQGLLHNYFAENQEKYGGYSGILIQEVQSFQES
jgi:hypothetical protein